jgi:hypothetical protein
MAHLTAALAAPDISLPLLIVAAAQFALFAGADMTLLMHVWRAHNQHQHQQLRTQQTQQLAGQTFGQQFGAAQGVHNAAGRLGSRISLLSLPLLAETAAAAAMQQWQLQAQRVRNFIGGDDDTDSSSSSSRGRFQTAANAAVDAAAAALVQLATGRSLLLLYVRFYLVLLLGEHMLHIHCSLTKVLTAVLSVLLRLHAHSPTVSALALAWPAVAACLCSCVLSCIFTGTMPA